MNSFYSTQTFVLALFKMMKGTMCMKKVIVNDRSAPVFDQYHNNLDDPQL